VSKKAPPGPSRNGSRLMIFAGIVAAAYGAYLVLDSYSNKPATFYGGAALMGIGALGALMVSFRMSRRDRRNGTS